ncbi:hypothetical protein [Bordetella genomosp. 9]|nr:hypothetical protein [Bordetella genomosp. 9]
MAGLFHLSLISGAVLAVLWAVGRAGDVAARWHRERDQWSAQ